MTVEHAPGVVSLAEHVCWVLLRSAEMGRLAVSADDRPEIFPINYVVDTGTIVFRTAPGLKVDIVRTNPAVAFEVDGRDADTGEVWSVVVKGHAEEIRRVDELLDSTTTLPLFPWHAAPKGHFLRIVPHEVTGRRFTAASPAAWGTVMTVSRSEPE